MKHKYYCLIPALAVACLLCGCGKKAPESVENYSLGDESVPSADSLLTDDGELLTVEEPADSESESSGTYTYSAPDPAQTAEAYAKKLTEDGFIPADASGEPVDLPDFSAVTGTVHMIKPSLTEGHLLAIDLEWTSTVLVVSPGLPAGTVTDGSAGDEEDDEGMTLGEAIVYFASFSPSQLGLTGESMDEYQILPLEGTVFVDGNACMRFSVYKEAESNHISDVAGTYLMTGDGKHVYYLDRETSAIKSLIGA